MRTTAQAASGELWQLAFGQPQIDPSRLATALEQAVREPDLDSRTRVLARDSLDALASQWGDQRFGHWLAKSPHRAELQAIRNGEQSPVGFTTIARRLMSATRSETIQQFLRDLGSMVRH